MADALPSLTWRVAMPRTAKLYAGLVIYLNNSTGPDGQPILGMGKRYRVISYEWDDAPVAGDEYYVLIKAERLD